jgi:hypothetical protein
MSEYIISISEPVVHITINTEELYGKDSRTYISFQSQFMTEFQYHYGTKLIGGIMNYSSACGNPAIELVCVVPASRVEEFKQWLDGASWK